MCNNIKYIAKIQVGRPRASISSHTNTKDVDPVRDRRHQNIRKTLHQNTYEYIKTHNILYSGLGGGNWWTREREWVGGVDLEVDSEEIFEGSFGGLYFTYIHNNLA